MGGMDGDFERQSLESELALYNIGGPLYILWAILFPGRVRAGINSFLSKPERWNEQRESPIEFEGRGEEAAFSESCLL